MRVAVIDSGVANLASVSTAFRALGAEVSITDDPAEVRRASHVVLPGVGAYAAGLDALRRRGLDREVQETAKTSRPLLAVCLGMQMLCEGSEESPGVEGLGVIPGVCRALPSSVRVPHLGWNGVHAAPGSQRLASGDAAFANSYCLQEAPAQWEVAWSTHGVRFISAVARERLVACQFHPELSAVYGLDLLSRWLSDEPAGDRTATLNGSRVARRIVPCLDVRHGRVVKGVRFQNLRDAGDPATQAALYESQGADEIVVLDVAASPEARDTQLETVRAVRARLRVPLTVGGGVRSVDDARRLLAAGADKVSVNTAAVRHPPLITEMAGAFGSQCVVLALDARRRSDRGWEVLVVGGRQVELPDALAWARDGVERGAGEILLTSWDRDGTRSGCDLELLRAMSRAVPVPIIASGGIGSRSDVAEAFDAGADAVLAASIFHDDDDTVGGIKEFLAARGIEVRR